MQKLYLQYLLNFLYKTDKLRQRRKIPAQLSVLETKDQGDYLYDQGRDNYLKKEDFPHYSNVIKLYQLPRHALNMANVYPSVSIKYECLKKKTLVFEAEDNAVMKVKQVYELVKKTAFYRRHRNVQIQKIANNIHVRFTTCKLMYDLLALYYEIDFDYNCSQDKAMLKCNTIIEDIKKAVEEHLCPSSIFIPKQQIFVSVKDLRSILRLKYEAEYVGPKDTNKGI